MITPELNSDLVRKTYQVTFSPNKLLLVSLVYLVASGAAEYTSHFWSPVGGIVFYLLIIFSLIVNTALSGDEGQRGFWLALGLAPIMRIISLVMPVRLEISPILWYLIISVPILAAIIALARALKYSLADIITNLNYPGRPDRNCL